MERCPCCNARLREQTVCQRCGSDYTLAMAAELAADAWLRQAMRDWLKNETEPSLKSLHRSLLLKRSGLAQLLRAHILEELSRQVLDLLAQDRVLDAKKKLYQARNSLSHSGTLMQLLAFTDYLLSRQA